MTTTQNGITVRYVRSNEVEDIFQVVGNGYNEYVKYPRSSEMTCEDILALYL